MIEKSIRLFLCSLGILVSSVNAQEIAPPNDAANGGANPRTIESDWESSPRVSWDSGLYVYDAAGNITAIGDDRYTYDPVGRLKSGTAHTATIQNTQSLKYDPYGNITEIRVQSGSSDQTFRLPVDPATNRIDHITIPCNGGGTVSCMTAVYDDVGNQDGLTQHGNYQWDPLGMMTGTNAGRQERYVYDADGERIVVLTMSGSTELSRRYTLRGAGSAVMREAVYTPSTQQWSGLRDYVHRGGSLVAAYVGSDTDPVADRHYHLDHLGTPRMITDASRRKVSEEALLPFGAIAAGSVAGDPAERHKFTGHERDGDASAPGMMLDYMHARYYSPVMGRFLSVDPVLGEPHQPQSWNRYAYASNNPIVRLDPDGKDDESIRPYTLGDYLRNPGSALDRYAVNQITFGPDVKLDINKSAVEVSFQVTVDMAKQVDDGPREAFASFKLAKDDLFVSAWTSARGDAGAAYNGLWGEGRVGPQQQKPEEFKKVGIGIVNIVGGQQGTIGLSIGVPGVMMQTMGVRTEPLLKDIKRELSNAKSTKVKDVNVACPSTSKTIC